MTKNELYQAKYRAKMELDKCKTLPKTRLANRLITANETIIKTINEMMEEE